MPTCQYQDELERWFDGELVESGEIEKHLTDCPDCTARLNELNRLRQAIQSAKQDAEIGDAQLPAFMRDIGEGLKRPRPQPVGLWALGSAIAAAIIVSLSLLSIVSPGPDPIQAITIEESSTDIDGATTESVYVDEETVMVWINLPDEDML